MNRELSGLEIRILLENLNNYIYLKKQKDIENIQLFKEWNDWEILRNSISLNN